MMKMKIRLLYRFNKPMAAGATGQLRISLSSHLQAIKLNRAVR